MNWFVPLMFVSGPISYITTTYFQKDSLLSDLPIKEKGRQLPEFKDQEASDLITINTCESGADLIQFIPMPKLRDLNRFGQKYQSENISLS